MPRFYSSVHQATRVIDCNPNVYQSDAPWHIEFPQGSVVRGTANGFGQWPDAIAAEPANFRVLTLAASGAGRVVADNSEAITADLAAYDAGLGGPSSAASGAPSAGGGGGMCSVGPAPGRTRAPTAWALAGAALLGLSVLRRARRA